MWWEWKWQRKTLQNMANTTNWCSFLFLSFLRSCKMFASEPWEGKNLIFASPWPLIRGFPGGSVVKESSCRCRSHRRHEFNPWVRGIPWKRKWQPTPVFLPRKSHGLRSLVGYSPWDCKESDTTEATEHACTHTHTHTHTHTLLCVHIKIYIFSLAGTYLPISVP